MIYGRPTNPGSSPNSGYIGFSTVREISKTSATVIIVNRADNKQSDTIEWVAIAKVN